MKSCGRRPHRSRRLNLTESCEETSSDVLRVRQLEIESLPRGACTRLLVGLVEDAIGNPIEVPVIVARGKKDGPVMGITSALHGNELNGIPVIHQLLRRTNLKTLCGTLVCVVAANPPGLLQGRREFSDGVDLNHIMPGSPNGRRSQVYAHEFVERIAKHFDYLVDLHTASAGRVNSLYVRADLKQQTTAQMAFLLRPQIIVHNPPSDYTLRGVLEELGKPAVTVEICDPERFQRDPTSRTLQGVRRILRHVGMTSSGPKTDRPPKPPVLCRSSGWILAKRGGLITVSPRVAHYVEQGDLLATQINIFGDVAHTYLAEEPGIVIGYTVNPLGQTGERIIHMGKLMTPEEKMEFETLSGFSLEGNATVRPGTQEIPSMKPM